MSLNRITLIGNVGRTPEIKTGANGKIATFSVATTERGYTKQDGTIIPETTEWHYCVMFGKRVEFVEKYVTKGRQVYIEGKMRYRKYTGKDNVERTSAEVIVADVQLLGSRQENAGETISAPNNPISKPIEPYISNPVAPFANQERYQQASAEVREIWDNNSSDNLPF